MEIENLSIGLAFLAGLVSFLSPCVLPLVPAYVGYMGGRATAEAGKEERAKFGTFLHGASFVLGFTIFFVGFGLLTSAFSSFLDSIGIDIPTVLTRLGGVAVILFGLYVMKALDPIFRFMLRVTEAWKEQFITPLFFTILVAVGLMAYFYWAFGAEFPTAFAWGGLLFLLVIVLFRKPILEAENLGDFWNRAIMSVQVALVTDTRKQMDLQSKQNQGYAGSVGMGLVFAAGWTPCIGPVYGAVLALAADSANDTGSLVSAGSMLTAYSLGLGIPFLLTALALNQSTSIMGRLKRRMHLIERFSGTLLLLIGVLILSGGLTDLSERLGADGELGRFSVRLEECTAGVWDGRIHVGSYPGCVTNGVEKLNDRFIADARAEALPVFVFSEPENLEEVEVGLAVGNRAPNFTLETLEGDTITLAELEGQAVLVNFWATWCGPCRAEMPGLQEAFNLESGRGFSIVAVNVAEGREQVQDFVDEFGLTFPIAMDFNGAINDQYRVNSYPTSYLIDGNGIITLVHRGPITTQMLIEELEQFAPENINATAAVVD